MQGVILIAEDNLDAQFILQHAFIEDGLAVSLKFVTDGTQVFEYLRNHNDPLTSSSHPKPSLIMLDLNMPYMNGQETLVELKTQPKTMDIPVVMFSDFICKKESLAMLDLGAEKCYTKPSMLEEYVLMVKDLKKRFLDTSDKPELSAPPSELVF